ncbi:MAG: hypothetical protein HQM16_11195 [Deltaproteobacteria bacterium]|nr:hypothetical protein [Deltaproteobacteria bacterium]
MITSEMREHLEKDGFVEIEQGQAKAEGLENTQYHGCGKTIGCTGGCTRSHDATFAATDEDWKIFLALQGGEICY